MFTRDYGVSGYSLCLSFFNRWRVICQLDQLPSVSTTRAASDESIHKQGININSMWTPLNRFNYDYLCYSLSLSLRLSEQHTHIELAPT